MNALLIVIKIIFDFFENGTDLTIAFPVYKRTDYFRTALESSLNQTVRCRVLVVNNNSPQDDFKKIIASYNIPLI